MDHPATHPSAELASLLRWEATGGTWDVSRWRPDWVEVALLSCDAGQEMGRIASSAADLIAYVAEES